ncbi:MAG: ABC transporter ATP-binding protein [Anaerococcus vaginalis]|uniref:ABC transporter, ATP-binding protein n=3 Tax=Anaerococcus TaxID=165779 RepID=C7HS24_9FIRM|nr:ABC transporter ATP-binding protein [Anaerococcus vaginalis]EEU13359.1 ABC transporter, ATP-binding protein [Anaerococcus vaginalis ATCC 51170]MDU5086129.1 ABC transporter ATP-binding protein [Anaerococcus vaginalis]MDU5342201.1 ABC transporter ATP-binding protein [Anaerococcus vaginalis]MDU7650108.1 ABC transporter ATP-binding protein [Anaerococcus vaginalis]QQB62136.1 ABC transporter ATP-binding protein [Anaerococcus vaginalis]
MDKYLNESPVVSLKNIHKSFGDKKVLKGVDFDLHKCEVHALLGENGAGKTTLMNILYGMFPQTEGNIYIKGEEIINNSPKKAISMGIGMVHQHFMLIEPFTVTENIILGYEGKNSFIDRDKAKKEVVKLSQEYGLIIDPDSKVADISVGQQQRVEILKALYHGADILIFDEPTAVLTPQEINEFIEIVEKLTELGKSVIIITHKLKEIKAMADTCTIIRRGEYIDKVNVKDVSEADLAEKMVGRDVSFNVKKEKIDLGEEIFKIEDLWVKDNRKVDKVKGLNLSIRKGEILGIAGVDGNGQTELIDAISGMRKAQKGKVILKGEDITNKAPRNIIDLGMNQIPEDRQKRGLVLEYPIKDNLILENIDKDFSKNGILDFKKIEENANNLIDKFDIRPNDINEKAGSLSGGNQQKVIIAREITNDPDLLIAAQPTRGLDVGAIEFIHQYLVELRNQGKAVLLISFQLDEVMDLSDRICVIYDGQIVGELDPKETDEYEVGRLMAGGDHE